CGTGRELGVEPGFRRVAERSYELGSGAERRVESGIGLRAKRAFKFSSGAGPERDAERRAERRLEPCRDQPVTC
ncbi:MAG: hypothetical protein WBW35_11155, partial [Xanthobacteraceae bacterium]